MAKKTRTLLPWEEHTGCPTCRAKPREECVVVNTQFKRYESELIAKGKRGLPTRYHKARYDLYCYLWGSGS